MSTQSGIVSLDMHTTKLLHISKVPLGVQLFNENKTDEMCAIMKALQSYVPKKSYNVIYHLSEEFIAQEDCYYPILFGGDQLTACRARGAQLARFNDDTSEERCDGLLPVVEDWHARMTLMRVSLRDTVKLLCTFTCIGNLERDFFKKIKC